MLISSHRSRSGSAGLRARAGFTLVELLVVISIMLVLTSVFILNQQRFDSSTLLRSLAYSIALSVRQAQVYGTSIRESSIGAFDSGTAAKAYGLYFSAGSTGSYILFADANNNGQYDSGEAVQTFSLSNGYAIAKFCASATASAPCWTALSPTITTLTVLFRRPDPDACVASSASLFSCAIGATPVYTGAYVELKSSSDTRSVSVTLTGQISVGAQGS